MFLFEALEKLLPKKESPIPEPKDEASHFDKSGKTNKYPQKSFPTENRYKKEYPQKSYQADNKKENAPANFTTTASTPLAANSQAKPKSKFVKTESAYVLFITSSEELSIMLNNEKTSVKITGLDYLYAQHSEHSGAFQKFVKNYLYENVRKEKVFLRFDENSTTHAQVYFDFKCQESLLSRLSEAAQNFKPNAAPKTNYNFNP